MEKIDKRKKYYLMLDVEGAGSPTDAYVYDLGCAVIDRLGNVYDVLDLVIYDIYVGEKEKMANAYYADKLPQYEKELKEKVRKMVKFSTAQYMVKELMEKYNINVMIAHNARYDRDALNNTLRYLTDGEKKYFFPYGTEIWDTQKMANDTICKQKTYIRWCEKNGYVTKHTPPRPQAKAEVLYKYISFNNEFEEKHTGLEDVMIEKEIFAKCMRQHKKMRKCL
jgi:hypothetical protein